MSLWKRLFFLFRRRKTEETNDAIKQAMAPTNPIAVRLDEKTGKERDIIQSHILSAAKHTFSEKERNVFSKIIELFQSQLTGKQLEKGYSIDKSHHGNVDVTLPLSFFLSEEEDTTSQIETALIGLQKNTILYKDKETLTNIAFIGKLKIIKNNVTFSFFREVYEALLAFSLDNQKQELEAIMHFRSIYAQYFYDLLKNERGNTVTYSLIELKSKFHLEGKYKDINKFVDRVLERAKRELEQKGPFSFTYRLVYEKEGRRKVEAVVFKRKEQVQTKIQKKRKSQVSKTRKSGRKKSAKTPDSSKDKNQSE